jgi:hypothetical protein
MVYNCDCQGLIRVIKKLSFDIIAEGITEIA